ncbi:MAG: ATP-dependent zinc metalloprotease FtsH [Spirochaetaceae bacterium]|nr:ATP-dependent zinc metalloprotease FtsH [Spirochaetaceae bacterium]
MVFALIAVALISWFLLRPQESSPRPVSYTEFTSYVDRGEVGDVKIYDDSTMEGMRADKSGGYEAIRTIIPYQDPFLIPTLREKGITVSGGRRGSGIAQVVQFLPWVVTILFLFIMMRAMQGGPGGNKVFQFGKSRARRYDPDSKKKMTFADIAGQTDAKAELEEVVAFLRNPQKFTKMGARIPKGVLLVGMPGTGKTLMARAVAGEAEVPYFHMSGSDFVEMFVGVGASRVRDLFEQGKRHAPCIIFIDELDAVGRTRGAGYGGGHDEREQTLNQLLVEMDGFDPKESIIILAATNRPDVLDPALLRPGRFDRQVTVSMPDVNEREAILAIHAKKVKLGGDVNIARVARATPGMSGADLSNLVNEAALYAARKDKDAVTAAEFEEARDKILMGIARKTLAVSDKERRMTAVHEAGHALLHYFLPNADPLHKVTIVPHGQSLGMAVSLPEADSYSRTRNWIQDRISICYGGFAAEQLVYAQTTTGTKNDLQQATELARKMVCEWGMADELGPIAYGQEDEPIFLGKEIARHKDYSEDTAQHIDRAVKAILDAALGNAKTILEANRAKLETLADALLRRETLADSEVRRLLKLPKKA